MIIIKNHNIEEIVSVKTFKRLENHEPRNRNQNSELELP